MQQLETITIEYVCPCGAEFEPFENIPTDRIELAIFCDVCGRQSSLNPAELAAEYLEALAGVGNSAEAVKKS